MSTAISGVHTVSKAENGLRKAIIILKRGLNYSTVHRFSNIDRSGMPDYPVPVKMIGMTECSQSGTPQELFKCYNLTAEDIAKAAKTLLKTKRSKKR